MLLLLAEQFVFADYKLKIASVSCPGYGTILLQPVGCYVVLRWTLTTLQRQSRYNTSQQHGMASGTLHPFPFCLFPRNLSETNKKYKPFSAWNLSTVKTASNVIIIPYKGEITVKESQWNFRFVCSKHHLSNHHTVKIIRICIISFEIDNPFNSLSWNEYISRDKVHTSCCIKDMLTIRITVLSWNTPLIAHNRYKSYLLPR